MHLSYVYFTETCWNGASGSASTLTAPHQPQHNTSSKRSVCFWRQHNQQYTIHRAVSRVYISLFLSFTQPAGWLFHTVTRTFRCIDCGLGNVYSWMSIWRGVFGWSLSVVLFSEWCFFVVFFIRLLTASQPCCLVLKVACEWQKSLVASSTSPKRRCLTALWVTAFTGWLKK